MTASMAWPTKQEKGKTRTPLTRLSTSRKLIAQRLSCWGNQKTRRSQAKNKPDILDKNDPLKTRLTKQMTGTVKRMSKQKTENHLNDKSD